MSTIAVVICLVLTGVLLAEVCAEAYHLSREQQILLAGTATLLLLAALLLWIYNVGAETCRAVLSDACP